MNLPEVEKNAPAEREGASFVINFLRRHYPHQVKGREHTAPISADLQSAPLFIFCDYNPERGICQEGILSSAEFTLDAAADIL